MSNQVDMIIKTGISAVFLLLATGGYAQDLDSVILRTSPKPYFSLDSRNTVVQNNAVRFFGFKLGMEWLEKYRAGLGYYTLTSDVRENGDHQGSNVPGELSFNYSTLFAEYRFFSSKKWAMNATLHNGFGQAYLVPVNRKPGIPGRIDKQFVWLLEPQISARYNILNWLALGGALGIRKTLIPDLLETNNLNGGVVSLNFQVFPVRAYRALRKAIKKSD